MHTHTVFIRLPSPFPQTLQLSSLPSDTTLSSLSLPIALSPSAYLRSSSSGPLNPSTTLAALSSNSSGNGNDIHLQLGVRFLGGKGGFGSQLRAAGGRMSSGKNTNNDSCRDLNGRRLRTLQEAKRMSELVDAQSTAPADLLAANKAKLLELERQLGITPSQSSSSNSTAPTASSSVAAAAAGPSSTSTSKAAAPEEVDLAAIARKRHRFEDHTYLEESREIKDNVRSAVTAGLLKKRKKNPPTASASGATKPSVTAATSADIKGKGKAPVNANAEKGLEVVASA